MTRLFPALLLAAVVALAGCPENELNYKTWTKKLDDSKDADRAIEKLVQLGNPGAIEALGEAWKSQGKQGKYLQAIISIARPLTAQEADAENLTDYAKSGRPASWDKALPFLKEALEGVDDTNSRSVESAEKAADALGQSKLEDGLESLIGFANKELSKKTINAQIRAIRAIGKYDAQKAKAGEALIKIIEQPAPAHPRTAKTPENRRALEEMYGLYLGRTGQAINSLSELRYPNATKTLVKSLFRTPELFTHLRRALVARGPTAEQELLKVLNDEQPDVKDLFKTGHYDTYCGDKGTLPPDQCLPVSARDFYPSVVIGDFYNPKDSPVLLAALKRPALPVYYQDDQPSPNSQYNAIFDALRKIGAEDGAAQVHDMWAKKASAPARGRRGAPAPDAADAGADLETRKLAISAYAFMVRGDTGAAELGAIAADNEADQYLRTEAATAFARLAHSKGDVIVLQNLAAKYFDASEKKKKESQGQPKKDAEAADKELAKAKEKFETVKKAAAVIANDKNRTTDEIRKAAEDAKTAEDAYKEAKKKHTLAVAPFKQLEHAVKDYKNYGRMFQTHIARIEVAIRCKDNLDCYADTLKLAMPDIKKGSETAAKNCADYIKDLKDWTQDEKVQLVEGEVERAMLEIGKRGKKAEKYTDTLLEAAKSDDRLVRQSILLALPKIATVPCKECEKKLAAAVKAGEGKSTLGDLNLETTMLRNYFA